MPRYSTVASWVLEDMAWLRESQRSRTRSGGAAKTRQRTGLIQNVHLLTTEDCTRWLPRSTEARSREGERSRSEKTNRSTANPASRTISNSTATIFLPSEALVRGSRHLGLYVETCGAISAPSSFRDRSCVTPETRSYCSAEAEGIEPTKRG